MELRKQVILLIRFKSSVARVFHITAQNQIFTHSESPGKMIVVAEEGHKPETPPGVDWVLEDFGLVPAPGGSGVVRVGSAPDLRRRRPCGD